PGDLEGDILRVDRVHLAVVHHRADVADRIARDHAALKRLADALLGRGDELRADRAAEHLVTELELALVFRQRLDAQEDARELALAAGLLLVGVLGRRRLGDRLEVRHLRDRYVHADAAALGTADRDVDVRAARAFEDRLLQRGVLPPAERRIGVGQVGEDLAHLGAVALRARVHRHGVNRLGELRARDELGKAL